MIFQKFKSFFFIKKIENSYFFFEPQVAWAYQYFFCKKIPTEAERRSPHSQVHSSDKENYPIQECTIDSFPSRQEWISASSHSPKPQTPKPKTRSNNFSPKKSATHMPHESASPPNTNNFQHPWASRPTRSPTLKVRRRIASVSEKCVCAGLEFRSTWRWGFQIPRTPRSERKARPLCAGCLKMRLRSRLFPDFFFFFPSQLRWDLCLQN